MCDTTENSEVVALRVEDLTRSLDFSVMELCVLPSNLLEFGNVEEIVLAENEFTEIPAALFDLPRLKTCNLSHNLIVKIGKIGMLKKWKQLERLSLSYNSIFTIPEYIHCLSSLKTLDIEHNGIKELPSQLCSLQHLRSLNISHNLIEQLPNELPELKNLKYFIADENKLTSLPPYPETLKTRLQRVSLRNNPIKLPDATITRFRDNGISVQFGSSPSPQGKRKRGSVPNIETSTKPKSIRRSASSGTESTKDDISQLAPGQFCIYRQNTKRFFFFEGEGWFYSYTQQI